MNSLGPWYVEAHTQVIIDIELLPKQVFNKNSNEEERTGVLNIYILDCLGKWIIALTSKENSEKLGVKHTYTMTHYRDRF